MDMGGGATEDVPAGTPAASPFTQTFTMVNPSMTDATYTYTVTVTDSSRNFGMMTGTYTVGPISNEAPSIDSLIFVDGVLTATVSDPDETGALSVDIVIPMSMVADAAREDAAQVTGATATFNLGA